MDHFWFGKRPAFNIVFSPAKKDKDRRTPVVWRKNDLNEVFDLSLAKRVGTPAGLRHIIRVVSVKVDIRVGIHIQDHGFHEKLSYLRKPEQKEGFEYPDCAGQDSRFFGLEGVVDAVVVFERSDVLVSLLERFSLIVGTEITGLFGSAPP